MNKLNFAQALVTELFNDESGNLKNKTAFNIEGTEFSYGLFTQATLDYYYYFQQKGVIEASVVGVSASRPMTQQAMFMALVLLGCTSFRLDVVAEKFKGFIKPTHIFIVPFDNDISYEKFIGGDVFIDIIKHPDNGVLTKEGASNLLPNFSSRNEDEKICIYKATSGTTGRSNLVPLTYGMISERTSPSIISDCTSPVHIGFNPISIIFILSIFRNLRRFGETIISKNVNLIQNKSQSIIAAPYTALEICKRFSPTDNRMQVLQLGGGKMNQSKIINLLEKHFHKVVDSYGCTESGHIMKTVYILDDDKLDVSQKISNGVEIQAPNGSTVEESGEIGFRTTSMAQGYIGDTSSTANFFRNGWFYSGDQGYMDNQSMLHIVGRDSDVVNLGGDKFDLNGIDYMLKGVEGVEDIAAFTLENDAVMSLGVAVVCDAETQRHIVFDRIREKILQLSGMLKGEYVRIYPVTGIKLNQHGKISRHDLKKTLSNSGFH